MSSTPQVSPILPGAAMVRAILDGRKTQLRVPVKSKFGPLSNLAETDPHLFSGAFDDPASWGFPFADDGAPMSLSMWKDFLCPFGGAGALLWVRETWNGPTHIGELPADWESAKYKTPEYCRYRASGHSCDFVDENDNFRSRWTPSINMPRWASRLTLRIVDVRPQRLQSISEQDAKAEGIGSKDTVTVSEATTPTYRHAFSIYWDNVHKGKAWGNKVHESGSTWADNPWVWAVSFEAIRSNIAKVLGHG